MVARRTLSHRRRLMLHVALAAVAYSTADANEICFLSSGTALSWFPIVSFVSPIDSKRATPTRARRTTCRHAVDNDNNAKRTTKIAALEKWGQSNGVKLAPGVRIEGGNSIAGGGLGIVALEASNWNPDTVLMQVPSDLAVTVQRPAGAGSDTLADQVTRPGADARKAPWFVQMSLQLNALRKGGNENTMGAWLDSLPREFDTPLHWTAEQRQELQYPFLTDAVQRQEKQWKSLYDNYVNGSKVSFDDFVWGCHCARSRAFSGNFGGVAFSPLPYALATVLVVAYVSLGLGTVEQAANGAALVVCGTILKDFVVPKLFFKSTQYVLCPVLDMANHLGYRQDANVAFEYFGNSYSLATKDSASAAGSAARSSGEVFISYGPRSNDQLLQYYGFTEPDNVHDVYVMPPLREWDIAALEQATGRSIQPGRLAALERVGLLGTTTTTSGGGDLSNDDTEDDDAPNRGGGVVITRAGGGMDPAILQALRALVSTEEEWSRVGSAVGGFAVEGAGGDANEAAARMAARTAIQAELESKPTTLEQDAAAAMVPGLSPPERLAVQFRMEKKKLLQETLENLH